MSLSVPAFLPPSFPPSLPPPLPSAQVKGIQQVEDDELKEVNEKEVETLEQRLAKAGIPSAE